MLETEPPARGLSRGVRQRVGRRWTSGPTKFCVLNWMSGCGDDAGECRAPATAAPVHRGIYDR
eukprot:2400360-Pyramimonas_sp.AAC.1